MKLLRPLSLSLLAALSIAPEATTAQPPAATFVSFEDFITSVESADATTYLVAPDAKVESDDAFEDMREHILSLYDGVQVTHSFLLGPQYVDCVPILQQPSVRALGLTELAADASDS